jgi:hypothetical protein
VDALALLLAFGSANTWREDLHLARSVPCLAHTPKLTGAVRRPVQRVLGILLDEATGRILVQDAGQQCLIRDALLKGPLLQGLKILA